MQTCSVFVALSGSTDTVILKEGVTVPEVLVLMAGHGKHSVTRIPRTLGEAESPNAKSEIDRLIRAYGDEPVSIAFGANRFNIALPEKFEDIDFNEADPYAGITAVEVEAVEESPKPAAKPAKKAVAPIEPEA